MAQVSQMVNGCSMLFLLALQGGHQEVVAKRVTERVGVVPLLVLKSTIRFVL